MNVASYTFKSPYPSSVQVGRPDPSSKQDNNADAGSENIKGSNTTLTKAENFQANQTQEVKPKLDTGRTLDIYA